MTTLAPDGLLSLITPKEAASLCGVALETIYSWRSRGLLEPSGLDERGRPLYRVIDVARAEQKTRAKARR